MIIRKLSFALLVSLGISNSNAQGDDLAKEKELVCAGYAHIAIGVARSMKIEGEHSAENFELLKFKYMIQGNSKFIEQMKIPIETVDSAQKRAKDAELAIFEKNLAEAMDRKLSPEEFFGSFVLKRREILGCD